MRYPGKLIGMLLCCWPVLVPAQQLGFRQFSLEEGLPQSEVLSVIQDQRGIIWAGTNGGGLVRFNGREFRTYTTQDGLPDNIIYSLSEDPGGNLWMGSVNCLVKYDGMDFTFYRESDQTKVRYYNQVFADQNGITWALTTEEPGIIRLVRLSGDRIICTSDQFDALSGKTRAVLFTDQGPHYVVTIDGIYELSDTSTLKYSLLNDDDAFRDRIIVPRFKEKDGTLWLSTVDPMSGRQALYYYQHGVLNDFPLPDDPWFNGVVAIYWDSHGRCWFSNIGAGIALYDPDVDDFYIYRQSNGLPSDFILGFMEDHEGNIWMGSRGSGLIKYSPNSFISYSFDKYINGDVVRRIYQDQAGNLWFALAANGMVRYRDGVYTTYSKEEFPGIHNVRGITELSPGRFLLASINGLYEFDGTRLVDVGDEYGIPAGYAYTHLLRDGDTIWLSSLNRGLIQIADGRSRFYSMQSGHLESNIINSMFMDRNGDLWVCTNNGVGRFQEPGFDWYSTEEGLAYPITLQMTEDTFGRYWIAGYMGGINIYDSEEFKLLSEEEGLHSDNIYSIMTDPEGNIWAGLSNGVDRIQLDSAGGIAGIRNFGKYEGFTGIENNGSANYIDREGHLWFGTVKGAMRYDPMTYRMNNEAPKTHISGLKLYFREVPWEDPRPWYDLPGKRVFPHDSNHFMFEFEAASYQVPEKVRYQWKLEGLDKDWSPVSNYTDAVYANIPPGEYTFLVKAMNNDGVWNAEPDRFSFVIKPPWWSTWYFISLYVLVFLGVVLLIFRYRIRRIEARKKELEAMVASKTAEVRAQNKQLETQKEEIQSQAENLQTAYNNLENLSEIGKAITSKLSVEQIIETVYESINKLMDATVFGIGILNEENGTIDFQGVKEKGETLGFLSFSLDDELRLSAYCVKEKEEIFINDFEEEYHQYLPAITPPTNESGNSSSIIYLPLILNEKVIGVITVQSFEKNAYTDYHLNILRNLAVYTKIALENASAYHQIELQSENLRSANTSISKQKQEIESANRELIDLNNEKNHLIGIVAHDLRNPLTSSLSIAQSLDSVKDMIDEEHRESLPYLVNALKRMYEMISKILDIRMIESRKINMECERTDLGSLAAEVCTHMQDTAALKNITLRLEQHEAYGLVDRHYLTQVFENLLSNAIKFSPKNKIVWIRVEDHNGEVRVNFIDEGPGIEASERSKLFGKYQRLSARPTAGEGSTGLGLSIVKKYVDVMGGRVWCESSPGKGSNFIVAFQKAK